MNIYSKPINYNIQNPYSQNLYSTNNYNYKQKPIKNHIENSKQYLVNIFKKEGQNEILPEITYKNLLIGQTLIWQGEATYRDKVIGFRRALKKNVEKLIYKEIIETHFQKYIKGYLQLQHQERKNNDLLQSERSTEIPLDEFTQQIEEGYYDQVFLIDRENVFKYQQPDDNYILSADVVNLKQFKKAKTKNFLCVKNRIKDAADTYISFICGVIAAKFPQMKVFVITRDHFGQILPNIYENIQCINPEKQDEDAKEIYDQKLQQHRINITKNGETQWVYNIQENKDLLYKDVEELSNVNSSFNSSLEEDRREEFYQKVYEQMLEKDQNNKQNILERINKNILNNNNNLNKIEPQQDIISDENNNKQNIAPMDKENFEDSTLCASYLGQMIKDNSNQEIKNNEQEFEDSNILIEQIINENNNDHNNNRYTGLQNNRQEFWDSIVGALQKEHTLNNNNKNIINGINLENQYNQNCKNQKQNNQAYSQEFEDSNIIFQENSDSINPCMSIKEEFKDSNNASYLDQIIPQLEKEFSSKKEVENKLEQKQSSQSSILKDKQQNSSSPTKQQKITNSFDNSFVSYINSIRSIQSNQQNDSYTNQITKLQQDIDSDSSVYSEKNEKKMSMFKSFSDHDDDNGEIKQEEKDFDNILNKLGL